MTSGLTRGLYSAALMAAVMAVASAQERPASPASDDPRVGLKPGLKDAGRAAHNIELVANVPKPTGFFDPKLPGGDPSEPESKEKPAESKPGEKPSAKIGSLAFANSDIAFDGTRLFIGNFSGFNIYDISNPRSPKLLTSIVCPGGQGDMSVHGNLLVMSVEETRGRLDCGTDGVKDQVSAERFRGVRIFDISDIRKPRQVAAVQTCRGSHTHTLVVDPKNTASFYVYGSGTGTPRSGEELQGCSGAKPEEDPNTALFSIDVIEVPIANPENARIVNRPRIFTDASTGSIAGLWPGGSHGPGTQETSETNRCHDVTVFPELGLAAGACAGNGILLDISDPVNPKRLDAASDKNFAFWHSATFNNDATQVIFTDEWGGGTRPRCRATDLPEWGANAIFQIVDRKLEFRSHYKIPAPQSEVENCVAHNGSLVPVPGRDIMVQAWYQGGISVFDFTDPAKPVEIAYFDRGPVYPDKLVTGGHWSAYWYNGHIYASEMVRGLDVLRLKPGDQLTQNEIDAANQVKQTVFNPQQQMRITWAATPAVARAYVDQLLRGGAIQADRAKALRSAIDRPSPTTLESLAGELEREAASASGRDGSRMKALAETLKGLR